MPFPVAAAFRARWGKFFTSQPVFVSLCVVQMLGVAGLAVAATIEIEAVLLTPLVLAFLGLLLAWTAWQRKRGLVSVLFGLAFPSSVVLGVLLIRRL